MRIDKFLQNLLPNTSRTKLQHSIDKGNVFVNEKPVRSNFKIKAGDSVALRLQYPKRDNKIEAENIPLDIIYEDEELLVLNKPSKMVVHPAFGHYSGTLINALMYYLKDFQTQFQDETRPGLVHRLDKDTTGLMVIAKTPQAHTFLTKQFSDRTVKREYLALVWGNIKEDSGTIEGHIGRSLKNRKVMQVFPEGGNGKEAITTYEVIQRLSYVTLVKCILKTGRTHQIRVHFNYIKHPLFNDPEYGGDQILKGTITAKYKQFINNNFKTLQRQALHAKTLGFVHPKTKEEMFFTSELPDDFSKVFKKWETYVGSVKTL